MLDNDSLWKCPNLVKQSRKAKPVCSIYSTKANSLSFVELPKLRHRFKSLNKLHLEVMDKSDTFKPVSVKELKVKSIWARQKPRVSQECSFKTSINHVKKDESTFRKTLYLGYCN